MTSRSATSQGEPNTSGFTRTDPLMGTLCVIFGAVAAAALIWLWSLTLPDFDPPNWIRILGVVWMPIGVAGAVLTGILGRRGPNRVGVVIGLSLAALTVIAFVIMIATADY